MYNIDFFTADVMWLLSGAKKMTFSQQGATDLQEKLFGSQTRGSTLEDHSVIKTSHKMVTLGNYNILLSISYHVSFFFDQRLRTHYHNFLLNSRSLRKTLLLSTKGVAGTDVKPDFHSRILLAASQFIKTVRTPNSCT